MPIPVLASPKRQANFPDDYEAGGQSEPRVIALAGGNILIVWTEDADGEVGNGAGKNIVGIVLYGLNAPFGAAIQTFSTIDDEEDFDVAPTADGGFVLVYVDDDISLPNQTGIIWERFDASANGVESAVITTENIVSDSLSNPQVTVNLQTGHSMVTFSRLTNFDNDVRGVLVSASGVVGAEFDAALNGADFAGSGDVAILANGNYVSVYREADGGVTGAEARIVTSAGAMIAQLTLSSAAVGMVKVATLAGGNWVAAWSETAVGNGDIKYAIYGPSGGAPVAGPLIAASGAAIQKTPDVVALRDGGFVIVWDNDTDAVIEAQRFDAAGNPDGGVFEVENGGGSDPDVALTPDGRLVFTWIAPDEEIWSSIWDPRAGTLNIATDFANGARNFVNVADYFEGTPGNDTIDATGFAGDIVLRGRDGNDILIGNGGAGRLSGGFGNDILIGGSGAQIMDGNQGDDIFFVDSAGDQVFESNDNGDDIIYSSVSYTLVDGSVETLAASNQAATTALNLTGLGSAQSIFGNEGNNQLLGLGGNDQLVGYGGNDVLVGGAGIDYMRGGLGNDVYGIDENDIIFEAAGEGDDSLAANVGSYFLNDDASIETLSTANQAGTVAQNLTGNNFAQSIAGSEGANVLNGNLGNDLLRGYGGADIFFFDTTPGANNHDVIADMAVGVDRIALQNSIFTGLAEGNLGASQFRVGTAAQDADDRIIWNAATNQLFFDADGNGAGAAVLFAIVNGSPNLQASDFIIV